MLSAEGFEVVESGVGFVFQVIDVLCPGHVALKCYSKKCCFFADIDLLVV